MIVTGGGTGIGRAITETFANNRAKVLITGRREAPLQELSQGFPEKVSILQADVTKAEDRKKIIHTTIDRYGQIDVLVNNAGMAPMGPFQETTDEDFEQTYLDLRAHLAENLRFRVDRDCTCSQDTEITVYFP